MPVVNIREAKMRLSKLVDRAASGEEIIIEKAGKPIAKLIAFRSSTRPRSPGFWKGKVTIGEDFDELPPEIAAAFRGEET
jgi:prevent-host-death family protein